MHDDDDANAILKRRARYVAMALAGVGTATQAACGPCLSASVDADRTDASIDGGRDASIDASRIEVGPCLAPLLDVGPRIVDAGLDGAASDDAAEIDAALDDASVDMDAELEDAP